MSLLLPIIVISGAAAYLLWGTWLGTPALINAALNFWSLGILWSHRGAPVSGNYERVVATISIITSLIGFALLISAFFVRRSVMF